MGLVKKITHKEYADWKVRFYQSGANKDLRLGQAFLNKFYPHLACPELFYETDAGKAERAIFEQYVTGPEPGPDGN
ncbi:hypothetical protein [Burkholderia phage BCSR5]|nr:hypothetical protein [Burkholderia phage BCSR5]